MLVEPWLGRQRDTLSTQGRHHCASSDPGHSLLGPSMQGPRQRAGRDSRPQQEPVALTDSGAWEEGGEPLAPHFINGALRPETFTATFPDHPPAAVQTPGSTRLTRSPVFLSVQLGGPCSGLGHGWCGIKSTCRYHVLAPPGQAMSSFIPGSRLGHLGRCLPGPRALGSLALITASSLSVELPSHPVSTIPR